MTSRDAIGLSERLREPVCLSYNAEQINAERREAATQLDAFQARVKELEGKLSASEAGHQWLFDKYQSALKDAATTTPTREAIAAALRETAYKYFGDYEFSSSQWDAVHCLENAAKCFLEAESRATRAEQERDEALERAAKVAETTYADPNWHSMYQTAAASIAAAIRRLASGTEKEKI